MIRSWSFCDHLKPDQDLYAEIWFHFLEHCKTGVRVIHGCIIDMPVFVHMACDGYYTVLIIPLQNSLYSPDALHCFYWLKRRRDLERQKDVLWAGLQFVEQTQLWYQNRLKLNSQRQVSFSTGDLDREGRWSCAMRSCMQCVNGSLGNLMSDCCVWNNLAPEESGGSDWDLRWSNATLVKDVNRQNQQISMLELEKAQLHQQLVSYSTPD